MRTGIRNELFTLAAQPHALEQSEEYLARHLRPLLKRHETVLICFPNQRADSLGSIFSNAVRKAGATPFCFGPDYRWKTLLREAFQRRATAIFAPPSIVLGLVKTARATNTPLSIRTVILGGYPCYRWVVDGIRKWLDCRIFGCYTPGSGAVIAGFSCGSDYSIHLRSDVYSAEISDTTGEVILRSVEYPDAVYATGETGRLVSDACPCGKEDIRLDNMDYGATMDQRILELGEQLLTWSSILDYHAEHTPSGIALEVLVFPREKLPKLPSCAKLTLRPWDADTDVPFYLRNVSEIPELSAQNC